MREERYKEKRFLVSLALLLMHHLLCQRLLDLYPLKFCTRNIDLPSRHFRKLGYQENFCWSKKIINLNLWCQVIEICVYLCLFLPPYPGAYQIKQTNWYGSTLVIRPKWVLFQAQWVVKIGKKFIAFSLFPTFREEQINKIVTNWPGVLFCMVLLDLLEYLSRKL